MTIRRPFGACLAALTCTAALAADPPQVAFGTIERPVSLAPMPEHPRTSLTIVDQLRQHHYDTRKIDDRVSSEVFDNYLDTLDSGRAYLLAEDVRTLDERYRFALDDALKRGDLEPAFEIFNLFQDRVADRLEFLLDTIGMGLETLDFTLDETLEIDRSNASWPADRVQMNDLWRRRLKASVLGMLLNDRELEEIEELLTKRYRNRLKQTARTRSEDAFALYVNAFASTYDPHTQYFSPRTSENFNINMSLSLEGIGAVLENKDEYTTVRRLVPAGPADKNGVLRPADRIVGVGQGESGVIVDVVGWRLDEVVALIRGPKASVVRLEVIPAGSDEGVTNEVRIVRNTVLLEEQSAQKRLLSYEAGSVTRKVGVIEVPTFYADFRAMQTDSENAKSTTRDVRRLIDELKEEGVEGIVVDLRNNGGGSLQEAQMLAGLFIDSGPIVQVKVQHRETQVHSDQRSGAEWDGPLAVLVNRLSASASEIFAGAIQDYERGIVTGSRTFGKGTVQTLFPLNRGQLKVTQAKYYLPSGQSTQHQGVSPDIEFPETYDADRIGESALDDAMPWDMAAPAPFPKRDEVSQFVDALADRHRSRVEGDSDFEYLRALSERNALDRVKTHISLNRETRDREKAEYEDWRLDLENTLLLANGEEPVASIEELNAVEEEEGDAAPDPLEDPMLRETGQILLDYIGMRRQVAMIEGGSASWQATGLGAGATRLDTR